MRNPGEISWSAAYNSMPPDAFTKSATGPSPIPKVVQDMDEPEPLKAFSGLEEEPSKARGIQQIRVQKTGVPHGHNGGQMTETLGRSQMPVFIKIETPQGEAQDEETAVERPFDNERGSGATLLSNLDATTKMIDRLKLQLGEESDQAHSRDSACSATAAFTSDCTAPLGGGVGSKAAEVKLVMTIQGPSVLSMEGADGKNLMACARPKERKQMSELVVALMHRNRTMNTLEDVLNLEPNKLSVKKLRKYIPMLRMEAYGMTQSGEGGASGSGVQSDRHRQKMRHVWERKPADWPEGVLFKDPNNQKKPSKEELVKMFNFLVAKFKSQLANGAASNQKDTEDNIEDEEGSNIETDCPEVASTTALRKGLSSSSLTSVVEPMLQPAVHISSILPLTTTAVQEDLSDEDSNSVNNELEENNTVGHIEMSGEQKDIEDEDKQLVIDMEAGEMNQPASFSLQTTASSTFSMEDSNLWRNYSTVCPLETNVLDATINEEILNRLSHASGVFRILSIPLNLCTSDTTSNEFSPIIYSTTSQYAGVNGTMTSENCDVTEAASILCNAARVKSSRKENLVIERGDRCRHGNDRNSEEEQNGNRAAVSSHGQGVLLDRSNDSDNDSSKTSADSHPALEEDEKKVVRMLKRQRSNMSEEGSSRGSKKKRIMKNWEADERRMYGAEKES